MRHAEYINLIACCGYEGDAFIAAKLHIAKLADTMYAGCVLGVMALSSPRAQLGLLTN